MATEADPLAAFLGLTMMLLLFILIVVTIVRECLPRGQWVTLENIAITARSKDDFAVSTSMEITLGSTRRLRRGIIDNPTVHKTISIAARAMVVKYITKNSWELISKKGTSQWAAVETALREQFKFWKLNISEVKIHSFEGPSMEDRIKRAVEKATAARALEQ